jgi:pyruvate kinase
VTREGKTAWLLSALRPAATIYAVTASEELARTLTLMHGVVPVISDELDPQRVARVLIDRQILPAGSVVVFINFNAELARLDSNFLNVQKIG